MQRSKKINVSEMAAVACPIPVAAASGEPFRGVNEKPFPGPSRSPTCWTRSGASFLAASCHFPFDFAREESIGVYVNRGWHDWLQP
jgi:hypothetical protein